MIKFQVGLVFKAIQIYKIKTYFNKFMVHQNQLHDLLGNVFK